MTGWRRLFYGVCMAVVLSGTAHAQFGEGSFGPPQDCGDHMDCGLDWGEDWRLHVICWWHWKGDCW